MSEKSNLVSLLPEKCRDCDMACFVLLAELDVAYRRTVEGFIDVSEGKISPSEYDISLDEQVEEARAVIAEATRDCSGFDDELQKCDKYENQLGQHKPLC